MTDLNILDMHEGNMGAAVFMKDAFVKNPFGALFSFKRMKAVGVTGSRLYMLWNDCCNRDTERAIEIMVTEEISTILHHIDGGNGRGIPF